MLPPWAADVAYRACCPRSSAIAVDPLVTFKRQVDWRAQARARARAEAKRRVGHVSCDQRTWAHNVRACDHTRSPPLPPRSARACALLHLPGVQVEDVDAAVVQLPVGGRGGFDDCGVGLVVAARELRRDRPVQRCLRLVPAVVGVEEVRCVERLDEVAADRRHIARASDGLYFAGSKRER